MGNQDNIEITLSALDKSLTTVFNNASVSIKGFLSNLISVQTMLSAGTGAAAMSVKIAFDVADSLPKGPDAKDPKKKNQEERDRIVKNGNLGEAFSFGLKEARENMQTDAEMMMKIGKELPDKIAGGLGSAWDSFITGSKSAGEAMRNFAGETLRWIAQIILQQMVLNAVKGISGYFSSGGAVGMASGGSVSGYSPSATADNIPAWLTAGEFVHPVKAVGYYGLPFMESIRRLQFPKNLAHALAGGTLPQVASGHRLAQGGLAAAAPATTVKTGDTKLRVINVLDKGMVGDYMKTGDGETAIINMIRRNGSTIKALLR